MLSAISQQENAHQNHGEILVHIHWDDYNNNKKERHVATRVGKDLKNIHYFPWLLGN